MKTFLPSSLTGITRRFHMSVSLPAKALRVARREIKPVRTSQTSQACGKKKTKKKKITEREEEMEREEREKKLAGRSTSVRRRRLIMGLRFVAGRQSAAEAWFRRSMASGGPGLVSR